MKTLEAILDKTPILVLWSQLFMLLSLWRLGTRLMSEGYSLTSLFIHSITLIMGIWNVWRYIQLDKSKQPR